jgi:hypothetical protein
MFMRYVGSEYQNYTVYSLDAPVAYENPTGKEMIVDGKHRHVPCHATGPRRLPDSMRWDYGYRGENAAAQDGGTSEKGCVTCHTRK